MGTPRLAVPTNARGVERTRVGIREVCESVPPPYFEWVGHRLLARLAASGVAA
jgi:hypothetical protein